MVREGMRSLLEATHDFEVSGEAATPEETLAAIRACRSDVICLDLVLGGRDGFDLIRAIRELDPKSRILVLSVRDEEAFAERCLQAGASGYAMKTEPNENLLTALRRVAAGEMHVSSRVAMGLLNRVQRPARARSGVGLLSERELQVFQLFGLGLSTRNIAERLGIGIKTVETHRENIKNKLGLEHSTALVREATVWVQQLG
jgi:two-component system, NarL family, response regulator FusR